MKKFNWIDFTRVVKKEIKEHFPEDQHLEFIVAAPEPLAEKVDVMGKPLADSVLIRQQKDVANYKRIMEVRHNHSGSINETEYQDYSAKVLQFIDIIGLDDLYIVSIATNSGIYETLFCPQKMSVLVFKHNK